MKKIIIIAAVFIALGTGSIIVSQLPTKAEKPSNPAVKSEQENVELIVDLPEDFGLVQTGEKLVIANVVYGNGTKTIKIGYAK